MAALTDDELKALSYYAIGVSSEGGDVAYQLSLAGKVSQAPDGVVSLRPVGNSGYSVGTLQTDLGQNVVAAGDLVGHFQSWAKTAHPDWALSDQQQAQVTAGLSRDGHHIRDANYDADKRQYGATHIPADRYPQAGPDIDQTVKSRLNAYLATDAGKSFVHQQDVVQVQKLTEQVGHKLGDLPPYQNASPEDQARIFTTVAKVYNQNEAMGREILNGLRDHQLNNLSDIDHHIDSLPRYMRDGRDAAQRGADHFIALRDTGSANSMHEPWRAVSANPLVDPSKLDQDPKQPHLRDQYATVRGSFVDPAQGCAMVDTLEHGGSHDYGNPASHNSRGFYAEGKDLVQWDRDGQGRAFVGGQWTEFKRDELTLKHNPDHTLDLDLTRNGRTNTLLHVTNPTASRGLATPHPSTSTDTVRQHTNTLRQQLHTLGYLDAAPDRVSGAATDAALKSFQHQNGLKPDGHAGPRTDRALQAAVALKPSAPPALSAQDIQNAWNARLAGGAPLAAGSAAPAAATAAPSIAPAAPVPPSASPLFDTQDPWAFARAGAPPSPTAAAAVARSTPTTAVPLPDARDLWAAVRARAPQPAAAAVATNAAAQPEQASQPSSIRLRAGP